MSADPRQPVLVIHGVATLAKEDFEAETLPLREEVLRLKGDAIQWIHVFWEDVVGPIQGIEYSLPDLGQLGKRKRDSATLPAAFPWDQVFDTINNLPNYAPKQTRDITQKVRRAVLPGAQGGLGDIFLYVAHRNAIQKVLADTRFDKAPLWGTRDKPISIVGHSLGGIIAFDSAVATVPPIWINQLITFGSQSAALHILDPRTQLTLDGSPPIPPVPSIARFDPSKGPVALPETITSWINVWLEMDPLAFRASGVFKFADGRPPTDTPLSHRKGVTWADAHGSYWTDLRFHKIVADALVP